MREIRCFVEAPLAADAEVRLPEEAASHLLRVLRLGPGDAVTLFNGDGVEYLASIVRGEGRGALVRVLGTRPGQRDPRLRIVLLQGLARGEKMDLILQKACELGVHAVWPVLSERSEVRLAGERAERRHRHWLGVLRSAAEQCGRATVPELAPLQDLGKALSRVGDGPRLLLDPQASAPLARQDIDPQRPVHLLVGPEGGLGARDLALATEAGWQAVALGPRILRTETAGLVALAVLQARHGDLG